MKIPKMAPNKYTSSNHFVLLPNKSKATFTNLFKELCFSRNIFESELLYHNISVEKEITILHKIMIVMSLLILLFLKLISIPLEKIGHVIEDFLNFGVTERDSEDYFSFLGLSDTRLDLNKDIKHEDGDYYLALAMMASKLAYENEAVIKMAVTKHWKMEFVGFYNFYNEYQDTFKTHAYIFREKNEDGDVIFVTFRGTSLFDSDNWSSDFDFSWIKFEGMGKAHFGFMTALGLQKYSREDNDFLGDYSGSWPKQIIQDPNKPLAYYTLRKKLKEMLSSNPNSRIIVTGHSLGGALAILFPSILALHEEVELLNSLGGIITYGQPRVGDEEFTQFVTKRLSDPLLYVRIAYGYDVVAKIPFDNALMEFKHFGLGFHFNTLYKFKIIDDEKQMDENIILRIVKGIITSLINFIVSRIIAIWEVIRGLFISYVKGPYFKEGWFMIFLRIFMGIPFPLFINHFPQDYVNSMCLASEDSISKAHDLAFPREKEFQHAV